jgi:hypothetical protein
MYSYISSWFFTEEEKPVEVSPKTKNNRHNVLKEVRSFDKKILLAVPQSLEEFVGERKESKIFTFKRVTEKKKRVRRRRKKSSN